MKVGGGFGGSEGLMLLNINLWCMLQSEHDVERVCKVVGWLANGESFNNWVYDD